MKAYFTVFNNDSNWCDGMIDKYHFQAKLFDTGSIFGINDGRVSKLCIWDDEVRTKKMNFVGACIVNYDRGWDIEPTDENKVYFDAVVELLESAPKRFDESFNESLSKLL